MTFKAITLDTGDVIVSKQAHEGPIIGIKINSLDSILVTGITKVNLIPYLLEGNVVLNKGQSCIVRVLDLHPNEINEALAIFQAIIVIKLSIVCVFAIYAYPQYILHHLIMIV